MADAKLSSKNVQILALAQDRVILKKGIHELSIQGGNAQRLVETAFQLMDGKSTAEQIAAAFPEQFREEIAQLLSLLRAHRFVDVPENLESDEQEGFFWNFEKDFPRVVNSLREAYVLVVGVGIISREAISSLLESGIGSVTLFDEPALRNLEFFEGERISDSWMLPLRRFEEEGRFGIAGAMPAGSLLKNYNCVFAASDFGDAQCLGDYNRMAHEYRFPLLPAILSDMIGTVGPLIVPGDTACWECVRLRRESTDPHADINAHLRTWVSEMPARRHLFPTLPPMSKVLGNTAAVEIVKFVGRFQPSFNAGKLVTVNLVGSSMKQRKVLRVPRCPVCSGINSRATTPIDFRVFLPGKEEA